MVGGKVGVDAVLFERLRYGVVERLQRPRPVVGAL
jgi:hypothetical protein